MDPVLHAVAGKLIEGPGILPGFESPPTIISASLINIFLLSLYLLIMSFLRRLLLGACCL
jgi:hypothetical protein